MLTHLKIGGGANAYYDCCLVSLITAKQKNPETNVALVTTEEPPSEYAKALRDQGVKIIICEFKDFLFGDDDPWKWAYFKLNALKYVIEKLEYANVVMLDTDTIVLQNFSTCGMWDDCNNEVLLYPLQHSSVASQMIPMRKSCEELYGRKISLIHYGGEFVAGDTKKIAELLNYCEDIYSEMISKSVGTTQGDEFLLSVAATEHRELIRPATPFVRREEIGRFYACSTIYLYTDIAVLHLPAGKGTTFPLLSRYYIKHGGFPRNQSKYYCLPRNKTPMRYFVYKAMVKFMSHKML